MKTPKTSALNSIFLFIALLVLATLAIFKIMEKREIDIQKNKALNALKTELAKNNYRLGPWMELDDATRVQLDSFVEKIRADENYKGRLPSGLLMNEKRDISASQSLFSFEESAWQSLRNSGLGKHLDYEIMYSLERVYSAQRLVIDAYAKVPEIEIASENDRKYSDTDFRFLGKLRGT